MKLRIKILFTKILTEKLFIILYEVSKYQQGKGKHDFTFYMSALEKFMKQLSSLLYGEFINMKKTN